MSKILKILLFVILGLVTLVIVGGLFTYSQFQPASSTTAPIQKFIVPKGQAIGIIGERLQEEGLIKNVYVFKLVVRQDNLANKIQAGTFEISPSMDVRQIARELTKGTTDLWVTFPEGWRREEIAESLTRQELEAFDQVEFLSLTKDQEGKLFPDTYLVPRQITTESLVSLLSNTFETKVTNGLEDEIAASDRSFEDVLIMASLVEREAKGYEQMRQVAGALWNRIDIGMALQVDATLQYSKGYNENLDEWWVTPLAADKAIDSPFNTYKNPGLPPQPICNPGLDAIKATLNPQASDYLFYIHDNQGIVHFAKTIEQHNANVNKYLR